MNTQIESYRQLGHRQDREALILKHLKLVKQVLGRVVADLPQKVDRENLHSAGILGLVEAARNFDFERGIDFPVFAYSRIRGAILDELRRNCPLPQQVLQQWSTIRAAMQQLQPPVTTEAIALQTGFSVDEVEECLSQIRMTRVESLVDGVQAADLQDDDQSPASRLAHVEKIQLLADAIEQLPQTMRLAITLYYMQELRMKEIGEVLDLSESRVSRIIASAELRLRSMLEQKSD